MINKNNLMGRDTSARFNQNHGSTLLQHSLKRVLGDRKKGKTPLIYKYNMQQTQTNITQPDDVKLGKSKLTKLLTWLHRGRTQLSDGQQLGRPTC